MREHVVDALSLVVEYRHDLREGDQLGECASPGLAGSDVGAGLGDHLYLQGPLPDRLTPRRGQNGLVRDGDHQAYEDTDTSQGGVRASLDRQSHHCSDTRADDVEDEVVEQGRPYPAA